MFPIYDCSTGISIGISHRCIPNLHHKFTSSQRTFDREEFNFHCLVQDDLAAKPRTRATRIIVFNSWFINRGHSCGPHVRESTHWAPGPPCRGAAERGPQTLRAPRYDLPASLVLALVLAHDQPPFLLRHTFSLRWFLHLFRVYTG